MFESDAKYSDFRATFKIWIPTLYTLDGTDFKNDFDVIVRELFKKNLIYLNVENKITRNRKT